MSADQRFNPEVLDNTPLSETEVRLGKAAHDEYKRQHLPHCGKTEYAGLMTKWEEIGIYSQRIWVAVALRVAQEFVSPSNK
jgi:hypothetical protein